MAMEDEMDHYTVTEENIELVKELVSVCDQSDALDVGSETWAITYEPGQQGGQMSRFSDGTGAVSFGGDSIWGEWRDDKLYPFDPCDQAVYDTFGRRVDE